MQFLTSHPQMGNWGTSRHFWANLFEVQLKCFGGWSMLARISAVKQFYAWCNFITTIQVQHFNECCLFGSVIFLCSQICLSFPGVCRSSNLCIPCKDLLPCRVNSPTTLGHCTSTGRLQLPHKATPPSSVLAHSVAIPSLESGTSRKVQN